MATTLACPMCQTSLRLPEESEGRQARCPACQHVFSVPTKPLAASEVPRSDEDFNPYRSPTTPQADLTPRITSDANRKGLPWESEGKSPGSYLRTVRSVLLHPKTSYQIMRRRDGIGNPLLFALAGGTAGGLLGGISMGALQFFLMRNMPGNTGMMGISIVSSVLGGIVTGIARQLLGSFMSSGLIHLVLLILGERCKFETTFRVVAYAGGSTALFQIVPQLGAYFALVWNATVEVIGIAEAHEISHGRAAIAVLTPLVTCCLVLIGFAAFLYVSISGELVGVGIGP